MISVESVKVKRQNACLLILVVGFCAISALFSMSQSVALVEYKGGACLDCGFSYPDCVYDFEHRDPFQKSFNIGQKLHRPLEELKLEADKCDLVCSNCHRIRTISPLISERKKQGWAKRKEREAALVN